MKNLVFAFAAIFTFMLTSCSENTVETVEPTNTTVNTANLNPTNDSRVAVVISFINAINSNNRQAALDLTTDQTWYAYGQTGGTQNCCDRFRAWLESDLFSPNAVIEPAQFTINGNAISMTGRWGRNRQANNAANYIFEINDGRVTSWRLF
jgi:hypothetical protein